MYISPPGVAASTEYEIDEVMPSCCPLMVLDYIYAKCFQSKYQQATNIESEAFLNLINCPRSGTDEKYKLILINLSNCLEDTIVIPPQPVQ